jgi:hypothetical protein
MYYKRSDMVYKYTWKASEDFDDPNFRKYQEHSELNRSEGYEVLWFCNWLGKKWNWPDNGFVSGCQKIEKAIHLKVPTTIRTHAGIRQWIENNHSTFWQSL